jgi:Fe-S-cluster containining protein
VNRRIALPVLDAQIDARVSSMRDAHAYWPCKEGCDLCCRSLPHLPTISEAEWLRLGAAIEALEPERRAAVYERARIAPATGPLTCPLLDVERGACLAYEARPIACRTYGYYAERDAGLHCERVTAAIAEHGERDSIVWGNGEVVASSMRAHGEPVSLAVWMGLER